VKLPHRVKQQASRAAKRVREHPRIAVGVAAAVLLVGVAAVAVLTGTVDMDDIVAPVQGLVGKPTLAEATERARKNPKDADAQLAQGHAAFEARRRAVALAAYENALVVDGKIADDTMYANLVRCFGTKHEGAAASLITRFHLVGVADRLDDLAKSDSHAVRWAALQTLSRIGKASREDYVTVWIGDLDSQECAVRRTAVESLGQQGEPRALQAIRKARTKDRENPGWFGVTCLGDLPDMAEKKILARR
jgi:hypothetical protein